MFQYDDFLRIIIYVISYVSYLMILIILVGSKLPFFFTENLTTYNVALKHKYHLLDHLCH